jgi:hypothetical protein
MRGSESGSNLSKESMMNDWLHSLPTLWMGLLVFGFTYLITAAIHAVVALFAEGERARIVPLGVV